MVELHIHAFMPPGESENQVNRSPRILSQNNLGSIERPNLNDRILNADHNRSSSSNQDNLQDQFVQTEEVEDHRSTRIGRFEEKSIQTEKRKRRDREHRNRDRLDSEISGLSRDSSLIQISQRDNSFTSFAKREVEFEQMEFGCQTSALSKDEEIQNTINMYPKWTQTVEERGSIVPSSVYHPMSSLPHPDISDNPSAIVSKPRQVSNKLKKKIGNMVQTLFIFKWPIINLNEFEIGKIGDF